MRAVLFALLVAIAIMASDAKSLSRSTQRLRTQDQTSVSARDPVTLTLGILSLSAKAADKVAQYVTAKKMKAADADNRKKIKEQKELLCSMLISQAETVTAMQSQAVDAVTAVKDKANPADVEALAKAVLKTRAYVAMRVEKLCGARAVAALKKHQEDTFERLKRLYNNAQELDNFYEEAKATISGDAPAEAPSISSVGAMVAEGLGLGAVEAAVSSVKSVVDVGKNFWGLGETINGYMIEIDRMNKVQTDTLNDMQYFVCATQLKLLLAHSRFPMAISLFNTISAQAKLPAQKAKITELTTAWKKGFLALAQAFNDSGCPTLTGVLMELVIAKKAEILQAPVTKDLWEFVLSTRAIRPVSAASPVLVDIKAVVADAAAPAGFESPKLLLDDGSVGDLPLDVKKALEGVAVTKSALPRQVKQLGFAVTDVSVYLDRQDQCSSIAKTFLGYSDIRPGKAMKRSAEVDRVRADLQAKGYDLDKDALILGNLKEDDKCVTVYLLFKKAALGMPVSRIMVVENVFTQRAGTLSDKQKAYASGKVFVTHTHLNLRTCELEKANAIQKLGAVCKAQYYLAVEKDPRLLWDNTRKMIVSPGDPSSA